jgi:hydroxymethylglutaryl-CoA lyase
MMLEQMGYDTGISLTQLLAAAALAQSLTGNAPGGRSTPWLRRQLGTTKKH